MTALPVHLIAFAACLALAIGGSVPTSAAEWKPLFNGRDLSGWKAIDGPADSWRAEDELLVCSGKGSGWLSTDAEYANFELELEFRVPAGGNSGVFLRPRTRETPPLKAWKSRSSTTTTRSMPISSPPNIPAAFTTSWRRNCASPRRLGNGKRC